MPTRRRNEGVRRSSDCTNVSLASELREYNSVAHGIPVSTGRSCNSYDECIVEDAVMIRRWLTCHQGYPHIFSCALIERDVDGVLSTVGPVVLFGCDIRLNPSLSEVRRVIHLNSHLLREAWGLRVATRDQDSAVRKQLKNM